MVYRGIKRWAQTTGSRGDDAIETHRRVDFTIHPLKRPASSRKRRQIRPLTGRQRRARLNSKGPSHCGHDAQADRADEHPRNIQDGEAWKHSKDSGLTSRIVSFILFHHDSVGRRWLIVDSNLDPINTGRDVLGNSEQPPRTIAASHRKHAVELRHSQQPSIGPAHQRHRVLPRATGGVPDLNSKRSSHGVYAVPSVNRCKSELRNNSQCPRRRSDAPDALAAIGPRRIARTGGGGGQAGPTCLSLGAEPTASGNIPA